MINLETGEPLMPLCTGVSAAWCPVHGDCRCPDRLEALDDRDCPLHSPDSDHAEGATE